MVNLYTERVSSFDVVVTPNCEIRFSFVGLLTDLSLRITSVGEHFFLGARYLVLPLVSWASLSVTAEARHAHEPDRPVADSSGLCKRPTSEPIKTIDGSHNHHDGSVACAIGRRGRSQETHTSSVSVGLYLTRNEPSTICGSTCIQEEVAPPGYSLRRWEQKAAEITVPPPGLAVSGKRYQPHPSRGCFPGNIPGGDLHETRDQRTVALALEIEWTNKYAMGKQSVLVS